VATLLPIGELAQKGSIRRQLAINDSQKVSHSGRMIANPDHKLLRIEQK